MYGMVESKFGIKYFNVINGEFQDDDDLVNKFFMLRQFWIVDLQVEMIGLDKRKYGFSKIFY